MDNTIEIKLERVNKNKDVNIINNKKVKTNSTSRGGFLYSQNRHRVIL